MGAALPCVSQERKSGLAIDGGASVVEGSGWSLEPGSVWRAISGRGFNAHRRELRARTHEEDIRLESVNSRRQRVAVVVMVVAVGAGMMEALASMTGEGG